MQNSFKQNKYEYDIVSSSSDDNKQQQQLERHNFQHDDMKYFKPETEVSTNSIPVVEIDMPQCPQGCVCQYAHLMDLPISRWINHMQQKYFLSTQNEDNELNENDDLKNNESSYEEDYNYLMNPLIKQATCIIQEDTDVKQLINSLPNDMQALILLYTGIGKNKTGNNIFSINLKKHSYNLIKNFSKQQCSEIFKSTHYLRSTRTSRLWFTFFTRCSLKFFTTRQL